MTRVCLTRLEQQYRRIADYESTHPAATVFCYANRDVVQAGERLPTFQWLGIGRRPPEPSGPIVADYVLGLWRMTVGTAGACWGAVRSWRGPRRFVLSAASMGGSVAVPNSTSPSGAALNGAHFISVDAPLVTQYLTPTADKAGECHAPVSPPTGQEASRLSQGEEMLCRRMVLHACRFDP